MTRSTGLSLIGLLATGLLHCSSVDSGATGDPAHAGESGGAQSGDGGAPGSGGAANPGASTSSSGSTGADGGRGSTGGNGDGGHGAADGGADEAGAPTFVEGYAAQHPALPQLVNSGGSVLASPKLRLLSWTSSLHQPAADLLLSQLGGSHYWSSVLTQYGVGAATHLAPVTMMTAAPASAAEGDVTALLADEFAANAALGAPDPSTIYFVLFPPSTALTLGSEKSCTDFVGYQYEASLGGVSVPFVAIPDCESAADALGNITWAMASYAAGAAVNPRALSAPAFATDNEVFSTISTLCEDYPVTLTPAELGNAEVPLLYSNAVAAQGGDDPCSPGEAVRDVYAAAMPVVSDSLTNLSLSDYEGGPTRIVSTTGILLTGSQSKTVELDLFAAAPRADWTVAAFDSDGFFDADSVNDIFTVALDKSTGNNGDKLELTVTATAATLAKGSGYYKLYIVSETENDNFVTQVIVLVQP